jgi:hypothetical protein
VQQQAAARLAVHVAAPENVGQIAARRMVENFRRETQLAMVEYPNHHACAALLFRTAAFYADFHVRS